MRSKKPHPPTGHKAADVGLCCRATWGGFYSSQNRIMVHGICRTCLRQNRRSMWSALMFHSWDTMHWWWQRERQGHSRQTAVSQREQGVQVPQETLGVGIFLLAESFSIQNPIVPWSLPTQGVSVGIHEQDTEPLPPSLRATYRWLITLNCGKAKSQWMVKSQCPQHGVSRALR